MKRTFRCFVWQWGLLFAKCPLKRHLRHYSGTILKAHFIIFAFITSCGRYRYSSESENNYFTEMCSGSEAGSYLRLIDFVYHSTPGLRSIMKRDEEEFRCEVFFPLLLLQVTAGERRTRQGARPELVRAHPNVCTGPVLPRGWLRKSRSPYILGGDVTKFVPHEAFRSIARGKSTFDERCVVNRVACI